ncbi:MAG TPA: M14 metallopeptidase family protein, partial [Thermoanaerobaculia bacterium]|nr:M14 metallopeptidase family protein [Thermoanaerobaculia bacterium]
MRPQRPRLSALVLLAARAAPPALPAEVSGSAPAAIPTPSEFLGFEVGADRTLADYRQIAAYLRALAAASDRVEVESIGKSTLGEEILLAVISSPANLANRGRLQEIARRIADPRGLAPAEEEALLAEGRVFLLVTCNIHATEIAASQMAMEWAHALATATDERTRRWLDDVVLLLAPSINPDGQIMETEWYRARLGTPQEGGRMPWLYHPYVGHDNNRDWFMLTQQETRAVSRAVYHDWLPQVWLDQHQMGATGPRMFVPPFAEPASPAIHPLVWRDVNLIGANMSFRLEQAGKSGVIYGYAFDAYWPGGTKNTAWWKNISGLLTEVASARLASPVRIEPSELSGGGKGLVEYGPQTNFPHPWPGGEWRLRDIMDYERIASDAILETCSERRRDLLANALARARAAIASFAPEDAWRLPATQRDPAAAAALAALLDEHGVELRAAADGAVYVPLAQPYGRFVDEMLSAQRFPEVKLVPGREIVRPYDVAAWTLPLMMGVAVERAALPPGLPRWQPAAPEIPTDAPVFALL